jgi:hypothetical protein
MGFRPTKVDPELWIRESKTGFEYLATYVDGICVCSKDPAAVLKFKNDFPKGCGAPEVFLVMSIDPTPSDSTWHLAGVHLSLSASTYITNAFQKLAALAGVQEFRKAATPMSYQNLHGLEVCTYLHTNSKQEIIPCVRLEYK